MGVHVSTVGKWKKSGKLSGLLNDKGQVNITRALKEVPGRISVKHRQSIEHRWNKKKVGNGVEVNQEEISSYLNETVGDLSKLDIYELQRRNELEKLLLAQIKRRKESGELIEADLVERDAFNAGKAIKEQCMAIADRTASLVAAESDTFKCKEIIVNEVNYILEGLSRTLRGARG